MKSFDRDLPFLIHKIWNQLEYVQSDRSKVTHQLMLVVREPLAFDGQGLRSQWIVTMLLMQLMWIVQITFHNESLVSIICSSQYVCLCCITPSAERKTNRSENVNAESLSINKTKTMYLKSVV